MNGITRPCGRFARTLTQLAATAALSILGASLAHAQFVIITPQLPTVPATPGPTSPGGTQTTAGATGNRTLTFMWSQGGLFATLPQPPTANYFVVCFDSATCTWPGNWNAPANMIPRVEIIAGPLHIRTGRYQYTFPQTVNLAANQLDRDITWTVGACTQQLQSTCSFGSKTIYFSTRDVRAQRLPESPYSDTINGAVDWDFEVKNEGTTGSGAFTAGMNFAQVLIDANEQCITSPTAAGVMGTDDAILGDGSTVDVVNLPANTTIYGITRTGFQTMGQPSVNVTNIPAGQTQNVMSHGTSWTWGASETARAYLVLGKVDTGNTVREFDESDNARVRCTVIRK